MTTGAVSSSMLYLRAAALFFLYFDIYAGPPVGQGFKYIHQRADMLQLLHLDVYKRQALHISTSPFSFLLSAFHHLST